jgi:iron(III) transport system substrate-binding protein
MRRVVLIGCVLGLAALVWFTTSSQTAKPAVVIYSAQDEDFAERLFKSFSQSRPFTIVPKYDTEATKSVSLVQELLEERENPRCDLHWNNEVLGTIRLARAGVYQPYRSPYADAHLPLRSDLWQPFAERARVFIMNTDLLPVAADRPLSLLDLTDAKWHSKVAMAKPFFGTTATHAACLFVALGPDAAKQWFSGLRKNAVALLGGNKSVALDVAAGKYAIGLTDTDDAIHEVLAGKPVTIIYPDSAELARHPNLGTLFIPNTLALIKNAPHRDDGMLAYDAILAAEQELAEGGGYQFPLNPTLPGPSHPLLQPWRSARRMSVDFEAAADVWDECQAYLREEFAR